MLAIDQIVRARSGALLSEVGKLVRPLPKPPSILRIIESRLTGVLIGHPGGKSKVGIREVDAARAIDCGFAAELGWDFRDLNSIRRTQFGVPFDGPRLAAVQAARQQMLRGRTSDQSSGEGGILRMDGAKSARVADQWRVMQPDAASFSNAYSFRNAIAHSW